jgi:hypothetical protein
VLRTRIGTTETMSGRLAHRMAAGASYLYDDQRAVVETRTAWINIRQPRQHAKWPRAFTALAKLAVHGDVARARIRAAIDALQ